MNRHLRSATMIGVASGFPTLAIALAQDAAPPAPPRVVFVQKAEVEVKAVVVEKAEKKQEGAGDEAKIKIGEVEVTLDLKDVPDRPVEAPAAITLPPPPPPPPGAAGADLDPLAQQFMAQFRPLLRTELHFIKAICEPTRDQQKAIARAGDKALRAAVAKYAADQQRMMQGQWNGGAQPDHRKLVQQGLAAGVKAHLTPDQLARYQAELDRRNDDLKGMAVDNLVAKMDQDLVLTAEQREKLGESLWKNWNPAWAGSPEMLMYGNESLPPLPDKVVAPILNKTQKRVWDGSQKGQANVVFGGMGFLGGAEMEADPVDEEAIAEARKAEAAEAKKEAKPKANAKGAK